MRDAHALHVGEARPQFIVKGSELVLELRLSPENLSSGDEPLALRVGFYRRRPAEAARTHIRNKTLGVDMGMGIDRRHLLLYLCWGEAHSGLLTAYLSSGFAAAGFYTSSL